MTGTSGRTPISIPGGLYAGHVIRRARKAGTCGCGARIEAGALYVEGEGAGSAGGFGVARLCLRCGGPDAVLAAGGSDEDIRDAYDHLARRLGLMPLGSRGYGLMTDLRDLEKCAARTHELVKALADAKLRAPRDN